MRFCDLVSKFNNRLAFAKRAELYKLLKSQNLLGKVFTKVDRAVLCPYLFHKYYGKHWPERQEFTTCDNGELEEARVHHFLDERMRHVSKTADNWPETRRGKEFQFYALLEEIDCRTDLLMQSRKAELDDGLSLALFPLSLDMLQRLRVGFPKAVSVADLATITDEQLKAAGFKTKPARAVILAYVAKRTAPKAAPKRLAKAPKPEPAPPVPAPIKVVAPQATLLTIPPVERAQKPPSPARVVRAKVRPAQTDLFG